MKSSIAGTDQENENSINDKNNNAVKIYEFKHFIRTILSPNVNILKNIIAIKDSATLGDWLSYRDSEMNNVLHLAARNGTDCKDILDTLHDILSHNHQELYQILKKENNIYNLTPEDIVRQIVSIDNNNILPDDLF